MKNLWLFGAAGLLVGGVWAGFFIAHLLSVGFEREVPGNWSFDLDDYRFRLLERRFIGVELYPTYLGWVPFLLVPAAMVWAVFTRARMAGVALIVLGLGWFSLGAGANPLIERYPFSGLDVARFTVFMAPFMALLGGYVLSELWSGLQAVQSRLKLPRRTAPVLVGVAAMALLVFPALDVREGRAVLAPVEPGPELAPAMEWLVRETEEEATVLAVGFRNWDAYWVPERSGRRIMDGWYDEGAKDWRSIREVRYMGWFGQVDALRLYQTMEERGTDYVVVYQWEGCGAPRLCDHAGVFQEVLGQDDLLFRERAAWPGITIFERTELSMGIEMEAPAALP